VFKFLSKIGWQLEYSIEVFNLVISCGDRPAACVSSDDVPSVRPISIEDLLHILLQLRLYQWTDIALDRILDSGQTES